MEREELKNLQSPLKQKYKEEPEAALVTLKAQGRIGEGITCKIETGKAIAKAGLHPATGGDGLSICSGDMLLEALVACAGVTMNAVATSIGIKLEEGIVTAEGDLDFRGTLGVSKEAPVGFKKIRLSFHLKTNASEEEIKSLIKLIEKYCVVLQTLKNQPSIETSVISKN
ncbi:MAG TPA: OsmC family protein [Ignavibacteriaceae bacterium]|nr:OsmC family protein [Ignavibacteriaceae bacterium]